MFVPPELPDTVDEVFALLRYPWTPPSLLPESIAATFRPALVSIANDFSSQMNSYTGYRVGSAISPNRRAGACAEMHIPQSETIVALYDDSMFGNGKVGIVFGETAIYWKLGWQAVGSEKGPFRVDYCQLQRLPIYWYTSTRHCLYRQHISSTDVYD